MVRAGVSGCLQLGGVRFSGPQFRCLFSSEEDRLFWHSRRGVTPVTALHQLCHVATTLSTEKITKHTVMEGNQTGLMLETTREQASTPLQEVASHRDRMHEVTQQSHQMLHQRDSAAHVVRADLDILRLALHASRTHKQQLR